MERFSSTEDHDMLDLVAVFHWARSRLVARPREADGVWAEGPPRLNHLARVGA